MTDKPSPEENEIRAPVEEPRAEDPTERVEGAEAAPAEDAAGDAESVVEDPTSDLLKRLEEAEQQASIERDKALRAIAELDNFRKRMARDRQDWIRSAAAEVIESLLPALDNLKLGLQSVHNEQSSKELARGFEMVGQQFLSALREQGLEELDPTGNTFDPHFHDSISTEPSAEVAEGSVVRTVKVGYLLNEKLLRPALVVVSSGSPTDDEENADTGNKEDER